MHICMDWRSVNFDWNRARAFLVTAEEGSLSAAARALGLAQPTLGRQVDALESELGVVLFQRAGRGLALTASGLELLDHVRAMGDAANAVSLTASGQAQSIEGTISITASEANAAFYLPTIVAKLRQMEPGIEVEVIASNTASDLGRREADIAVRSFRPTQPDLIAKKLRDDPARLYGSKRYLKKIGTPKKPGDLSRADFIGFDDTDTLLQALNGMGLDLTPDNFSVVAANHLVQWELVKHGCGIGVMPERVGDAEALVGRALPDLAPMMFPIWLTTHQELNTSRRVRMVFDLLAEELAKA
jgi:DNA-binding transcriptional LysR family regulator